MKSFRSELQIRLTEVQQRSQALESSRVGGVDQQEVKRLEGSISLMAATLHNANKPPPGLSGMGLPKTARDRGRMSSLAAAFSVFSELIGSRIIAEISPENRTATVEDLQDLFKQRPAIVASSATTYPIAGKSPGHVCISGAVGQYKLSDGSMRQVCIGIKVFRSNFIRRSEDLDCWRDFLIRVSVADLWTGEALFEGKQASSDDYRYNKHTDLGLLDRKPGPLSGKYVFTPGGLGELMSELGEDVPRPSRTREGSWDPEFLGRMLPRHFVKAFDEYVKVPTRGASQALKDAKTLVKTNDLDCLVTAWTSCDFSTARAEAVTYGIFELLQPSVKSSAAGFSGRSTGN